MAFRNKFKVKKDIKQQIEKEDAQSSSKNPYLIPYFKLEDGQKLKILFVPFADGSLWKKFSLHGPDMKLRGMDAVGCARENNNDDCPICQKGFDLFSTRGADKDSKEYKAITAEARRWMPKSYIYMSAIVLESPFEIPESPDSNEVKLISVPAAVEEIIRNQIAEGEITNESIIETPFFIKKTVGDNNRANYKTSYFSRNSASDEELEYFDDEDLTVEPIETEDDKYKLSYVDASPEELDEWLEKAEEKDAQQKRTKRNKSDEDDDEEEEDTPKPRTRTKKTTSKKSKPEPEDDDSDDPEPEEEEDDEPEPESKTGKSLTLKEKIAQAKAKKREG